jgi:hypothetical protein
MMNKYIIDIGLVTIGLVAVVLYCITNNNKNEEKRIKTLEENFLVHSDRVFYMTVFKIMAVNNLLIRFKDMETLMEDACDLYMTNGLFQDECYKHGIKPRFLEYMKKSTIDASSSE